MSLRKSLTTLSCLLVWSTLVLGASDCDEDPPETGNGILADGGSSKAGTSGSTAGTSAGGSSKAGEGGAGKAGGAAPAADGGATKPTEDGGGAKVCGTRGGVMCTDEQFCKLDETCGETDRGGACTPIPDTCAAIYSPVCGCDGKTYASDCVANGAGVSVRSEGECKTEECKVVKTEPFACTKEYKPVCGCDRKTYGNKCEASAVSSILHEGSCTESDCKALGGRAVFGLGPAPECNKDEVPHTYIVPDSGEMPIEGELCCLPK